MANHGTKYDGVKAYPTIPTKPSPKRTGSTLGTAMKPGGGIGQSGERGPKGKG